jgi:aminoglycoside/choline kinase family phosphotransferase
MKFKILPVAGDASFRMFYRLIFNQSSKIIVLSKKEKYKNLAIYSAVNKFLRANKILTPKLYTYDYSKGIMILEDFGDLSFYKILHKRKNKLPIYKKLVDLLLKIQKINSKSKIKGINNKSYKIEKYSNKYLFRESNLFFDWYLPLFLSKKKTLNIKVKSKKILSKLYNKLNFSNSYFVHRDYHSQNLMKVGKKIGVIDSQDALIGNPAYDLVSLIDDVRIKTSAKLKNQIYNYYLKKTSQIYRNNSKKFLEDFKILSVQRSLKIIGIFSRLFLRDKKKQYLKFIPYTWQLLEMRMNEEIFSELKKILNKNIHQKFKKKLYTNENTSFISKNF